MAGTEHGTARNVILTFRFVIFCGVSAALSFRTQPLLEDQDLDPECFRYGGLCKNPVSSVISNEPLAMDSPLRLKANHVWTKYLGLQSNDGEELRGDLCP